MRLLFRFGESSISHAKEFDDIVDLEGPENEPAADNGSRRCHRYLLKQLVVFNAHLRKSNPASRCSDAKPCHERRYGNEPDAPGIKLFHVVTGADETRRRVPRRLA